MNDWDEKSNSVELPKLFGMDPNDTLTNPRFEIFLDKYPEYSFAITYEELADSQHKTNMLIEEIMANLIVDDKVETEGEDLVDKVNMAPVECMKKKPILILIDHETGQSLVAPYDIHH